MDSLELRQPHYNAPDPVQEDPRESPLCFYRLALGLLIDKCGGPIEAAREMRKYAEWGENWKTPPTDDEILAWFESDDYDGEEDE